MKSKTKDFNQGVSLMHDDPCTPNPPARPHLLRSSGTPPTYLTMAGTGRAPGGQ